nr:glycosyltransferase family 4 protein [Desulfobaculum xiamenense]
MRQALGIPDGVPVLGTVAGNKPVKGVDYLLKAFAASGVDAHLVAVGANENIWANTRAGLGLNGRVHFPGRVENVADYLQTFDAFILPSLSESLPNVLIEAFGFGLPIIATTVGGVPEIVTDNGLLVPPKRVEPLTGAIRRICEDTHAREQWGRASLRHAAEFTIDRKVERSIEVYDRLLRRRGFDGIA